jgi:hypothetical protein
MYETNNKKKNGGILEIKNRNNALITEREAGAIGAIS